MTTQYALPLTGRTALVTGATRGIGKGLALDLARRGADIIITHTQTSLALAEEVKKEITSLPNHPQAFSVVAYLNEVDSPSEIIQSIITWFQASNRETKIDILVNNAGCEVVKPLGEITSSDFAKVYDLNVRGVLLLTQALLPYIPPKGRIINISSVGARAGMASLGLYCSSKAALEGLTRCWAAELGKNGTTVNAVNPGPVESELLANIPKDIVQKQKDATPIENRVGTVEEIAGVVGWLAGEDSKWVTGQVISASGGWAMY